MHEDEHSLLNPAQLPVGYEKATVDALIRVRNLREAYLFLKYPGGTIKIHRSEHVRSPQDTYIKTITTLRAEEGYQLQFFQDSDGVSHLKRRFAGSLEFVLVPAEEVRACVEALMAAHAQAQPDTEFAREFVANRRRVRRPGNLRSEK